MQNPDPDIAFMQAIPHNQEAVDMPEVALEYGSDREVRTLAQHIIDEQETEIEQLQRWQPSALLLEGLQQAACSSVLRG